MTRPSPAVRRIVSVLNFFAEHPQQAFTLTQITKSLRMNPSTCHALLMGLAEGGYLYRNPDKSYVLGPASLALANSAQQHFSPLDVARQEMRVLADELDVVVAALFLERDEMVVRERAASLVHLGWVPPPGQRYPLYPWGSVFMAPLPDAEIEAWMDKTAALSEDQRWEIRRQIEFCRSHGYVFAIHRSNRVEPVRIGVEGVSDPPPRYVPQLEPNQAYYLQFLTAPVMSGQRKVAFTLALHGFTRGYSAVEVEGMADRLREACGRITAFITGKTPAAH
jgi:DNA-binding IclR family transcriptional regulator